MLQKKHGATGKAFITKISFDDVSINARLTVCAHTALLRSSQMGEELARAAFEKASELQFVVQSRCMACTPNAFLKTKSPEVIT